MALEAKWQSTSPIDATATFSAPDAAWCDHVLRTIRGCGRRSAPGPDGLRRDLLGSLCGRRGSRTLRAFARAVDLALTGHVGSTILTASTLFAIPKGTGGGIRPIAVGTMLRRVTGKIATTALAAHIEPALTRAGQLGLADSGAMRLHKRVLDATRSHKWILGMDIRSAFNYVHRTHLLDVVRTGAPSTCVPLIEALYTTPSPQYVATRDVEPVPAARGVAQGCPLAAALFAMALQPVIDDATATVRALHPRATLETAFYADDGYVWSDTPAVLGCFFTQFSHAWRRCHWIGA